MQEYRVEIDDFGTERWYNKDNDLHRENDQPAVIYTDGDRFWYKNGKLHREDDKPAIIYDSGTRYWCKNGKLHRESGPAIINDNGTEEYWLNGVLQPNPNATKDLTIAHIERILGYRIKIVK
jgi:hypothetical protein